MMAAVNAVKKPINNRILKRYGLLIEPHLETIIKLHSEGMSEKSLAAKYGISYATWNRWKKLFPMMEEGLILSYQMHTQQLEESASKVAIGYYIDEETKTYDRNNKLTKREIKHKFVRPDTLILMFLLKARKPEMYKDLMSGEKTEVNITLTPVKRNKAVKQIKSKE